MDTLTPAPCTIEFDLPCVSCGYNLRTQPTDARCPECGLPIAECIAHSPYLWDLAHAQRVSFALGLIAISNALPALAFGVCLLLVPASRGGRAFFVMWVLSACVAATLHLAAARSLTLPPTGAAYEKHDALLRLGSICGAAAAGILLNIAVSISRHGDAVILYPLLPLGTLLVPAAAYFGLLARRLRTLCGNCGYTGLARAARWTISPLGTCLLMVALSVMFIGVSGLLERDSGIVLYPVLLAMVDAILTLAMLGALALLIPTALTIFLMQRRFGRVVRELLARRQPPFALGAPPTEASPPPSA